ncbi:hypothetical protein OG304_35410 [Streptomyces sp. NBC_00160]|uniref:hypothetical protein n=1 Tax=Streptomyces sp. NBC_00160 TaxID=2903628 RepID=UPI0022598486|nr:hypothetical protein [Streptomyces sp. NBC_00160]MCX5308674.1 hypothetical protein [Streptomyces sp. NBC_00160]
MKRITAWRSRKGIPAVATVVTLTAGCLLTGAADPAGKAASCPTASPDSFWHAPVDSLPVHPKSGQYVASIGAAEPLHPDFGSGLAEGRPFGIPVTVSDTTLPESQVSLDYAEESDTSGYRIPPDARIENGPASDGDRHVVVWDKALCKSYELFDAKRQGGNAWHAGSGAVFDLRSNALRPDGWTSADAAGLAILPGLARYDEAADGRIDHAIRITVPRSDRSYLWPARHQAGAAADGSLPPMGLRLRLKSSVDTSQLAPQAKAVADALKKYGAIVADNGSAWYITGEESPGWDNAQLDGLKDFKGSDFEAVDASGLQQSPDSGAVAPQ